VTFTNQHIWDKSSKKGGCQKKIFSDSVVSLTPLSQHWIWISLWIQNYLQKHFRVRNSGLGGRCLTKKAKGKKSCETVSLIQQKWNIWDLRWRRVNIYAFLQKYVSLERSIQLSNEKEGEKMPCKKLHLKDDFLSLLLYYSLLREHVCTSLSIFMFLNYYSHVGFISRWLLYRHSWAENRWSEKTLTDQ
jgi:hypothetical protein